MGFDTDLAGWHGHPINVDTDNFKPIASTRCRRR